MSIYNPDSNQHSDGRDSEVSIPIKKRWKIPVTWEVWGTVEIEADTLEEAIKEFDLTEPEIGLPLDSEYVDGSFHREDEESCQLNNQDE